MFLGRDKTHFGVQPWRYWSILARTTFLHTLTAFILFSIIIYFLHESLVVIISEGNKSRLMDQLSEFSHILRTNPNNRQHWLDKIHLEEGETVAETNFFFQVISAEGATLAETFGMELLANAPFPKAGKKGVADAISHAILWQSSQDQWYLLTAKKVETGEGSAPLTLRVALVMTDDLELVAHFQGRMVFILLIAALVSATIGAILTRRGMKPLQEIMAAVKQVTAQRLDERIAPQGWPLELMGLAHAFDDMLVRLEDSFLRLARFSADLAHELRTPINNLRGEAEVALARQRSPEEYREVLSSILEECQRLNRMVDGLLFLARAENPHTLVSKTPLDGSKELQTVVDFYALLAEDQGVALTCQGEGIIHADSLLLRQAISNLLLNALEYTPAGGRVVLSLHCHDNGSADILVEDNGCGIAAQHLPHIFDRLYRVEGREHGQQGVVHAGLGLAIVKSIAQLHQGRVHMDSTVGVGSQVTLFLPGLVESSTGMVGQS